MRTSTLLHRVGAGLMWAVLSVGLMGGPDDGEIIGVTKILDNGPDSDRFVLVLLSEGYTGGQLGQFANHAQQFVDVLVSTPPFDVYCRAFNVYRVDVASDDSGADDPGGDPCEGSGDMVNTYFDATFCGDGQIRRLLVVNNATAIDVMNNQVPAWDQGLVIVNTSIWGGAGGTPGTTSLSPGWEGIAIHEIGHSVFGLADEYEYWAGCSSGETDRDNHPAVEPAQPNVTVETDPNLVKWRDLFFGGIEIPTTINDDCTLCDPQPNPFPGEMRVGLYEGAHYYHCDAYRPTFHCMMRNFDDFCPVCVQRIATVLGPYLPPNQAPMCDHGGPYVVECQGGTTAVTLDGSGSSDDGCVPLTFAWSGAFEGGIASGESPTVSFVGLGTFPVTLQVSDGDLSSQCDTTVTIQDTIPPLITAPPDIEVECESHEGTAVALGLPLVFDQCDSNPTVSNDAPALFPLGPTVVTWTATDASGNFAVDTQTVTVVDTTPPILVVTVSPDNLWPPNHRWVTITADIFVEDICDDNPMVRLVSVESNEPENATGDGNTAPDIQGAEFGTDDREFQLRAERRGNRTGRVYTITYEAEDASGNVAVAQAWVTVDHDRRVP
jgi:hypothetical protein